MQEGSFVSLPAISCDDLNVPKHINLKQREKLVSQKKCEVCMIMRRILPRKAMKVCEIPPSGLLGKLIDFCSTQFGRQYIFEDETGKQTALYNCSALDQCLSQHHLGRYFKIIYKGQFELPDGRCPYDIEVYEIEKDQE